MAPHRFFMAHPLAHAPEMGDEVAVPLSAEDLHRAARAARLRQGERIVVVDDARNAWECDVVSIDHHQLRVTIHGKRAELCEPDVTLFAGLTKGHKMDLTVEKAVEVGASRIVPVECERSIVRVTPEKAAEKTQRWRRVSAAAAAQSQRNLIPVVDEPITLRDVLELVESFAVFIVAWEGAADVPLFSASLESAPPGQPVAVMVGPEGGLTDDEAAALQDSGARVVGMGANILRSETAGIVLAALTVYEMGGLGGRPRG